MGIDLKLIDMNRNKLISIKFIGGSISIGQEESISRGADRSIWLGAGGLDRFKY